MFGRGLSTCMLRVVFGKYNLVPTSTKDGCLCKLPCIQMDDIYKVSSHSLILQKRGTSFRSEIEILCTLIWFCLKFKSMANLIVPYLDVLQHKFHHVIINDEIYILLFVWPWPEYLLAWYQWSIRIGWSELESHCSTIWTANTRFFMIVGKCKTFFMKFQCLWSLLDGVFLMYQTKCVVSSPNSM